MVEKSKERIARETSTKRKYNEKAYGRVYVCVPKGVEDLIHQHAEKNGETVNGMINRLLRTEMGYAEWPLKYDKWEERMMNI